LKYSLLEPYIFKKFNKTLDCRMISICTNVIWKSVGILKKVCFAETTPSIIKQKRTYEHKGENFLKSSNFFQKLHDCFEDGIKAYHDCMNQVMVYVRN